MNANREIFTACLPAAETWLQRRHNSAEEELTMVKKKTDKELKELEKKIGKVPKFFRELTEKEPKMYELVMKLEGHIWDDGVLTRKTKKLIAIAIAAALRDQHAVHAQMAGAANLGVTKAEVEEALRVTFLLSGMPAYVYGKAQLDEVMK
jgi:alkylhydroperoxidase/carboxymuconolactone decarboxylase family protein YurZ